MNTFHEFWGKHIFMGAKTSQIEVKNKWTGELQERTAFLFCIDGETYQITENIPDGYRSFCEDLEISKEKIKPEFAVEVLCRPYKGDFEACKNNCMEVIDINNSKTVFVIGTEYCNDYYPCCLFDYRPQDLSINER